MKTISNLKTHLTRAAMLLLMALAMSLTASATDFITDVMVAGHSNQSSFNTLIQNLQQEGWTDIDYDLNKGCGSSSYYIHLLYKKQSSSGNTGVPITDFCIRTGANPPDNLTHEGRTYYLVPCQGSSSFVNSHGDLNHGASGEYIFLYYTKDALSNNTGVTAITFNTTQSGAVGSNGGSTGYDLNSGAGGAYIYMHLTTASGANVVTLSSGSGEVQLQNGHILTGTGGTETQVTIADGATVTFNNVNNTAIPDNSSHPWPGISCLGNATIVLNGSTTNSVKGGRGGSGIHIAANKTLTIQGSGTLNATGGYRGAGIGGGWGSSCGNITISGGTITATGGEDSAGIGSGYYQSSCGNITITNSVTSVTATKGQNSNNAVGAGNGGSSCGTVTIGGVQTGNITLSPFVTYPYTVSFNANGGTGTMNNQSFMYNVAQNLNANAFTNSGHQFLGWATSATGPKVYNDRQSVSNLTQTAGATVTLYAKWTNMVTLTSQIGEVLLQDGDTLSGTGGQNTCVKIADGATVTFNGVDITDINSSHLWSGISCLGDAVIVLNGGTTNSVKGGNLNPGIHVPQGKTLTIQGSGTLNATGGITAAGIGSGQNSTCGNIIISGGTVTATGGQYAAGIGSGRNDSSCGNITITNGVTRVTATKGSSSPNSIGAGNNSTCGTVTIGNVQTGFITTSPFVTYPYTVSFDANGGTGTMANQVFMYNVAQNLIGNAFNNAGHQFLGWATSANGPKVYDNGQSVINMTQTAMTLYAKWGKMVTLTSQIGEVLLHDGDTLTGTGGQNTHVKIADGATVTFNGVDITAIANNSSHLWAGITCLGDADIVLNGGTTNNVKGGCQSSGIYVPQGKTLTIQGGGTLNATGNIYAAGIGSGYNNSSCGNITISGGTLNVTAGLYAAGIGSGHNQSSCGDITIIGGTVTANSSNRSPGIGSGHNNSSCGNITITNGVTCVTATAGQSCSNAIGAGTDGSTCGTVTIGDVQTGNITLSPFVTYPYTVSFDSNGGTGSMADMNYMYNVARNLTVNSFILTNYVFEGWATSATGPKVYNDGQSVSNLTQESGTTVTLFAKWILDPTHISVSGNVYTIHTATGWDLFCDLLADNSNGYFTGKTVKLDTDISVTLMAGNAGHEFSGTFDGQGHTLTVSYQNTDNDVCTAPFSYVNGATIQNLIVAGNIAGTANRAAGIVGETGSSLSHVINCVSSVNVSGGSYTGGISIGGNVEITGCVFDGTITGTSMSGGFVGYSNNALVISNCLFAPQEGSSIVGGTFYYNGGGEITPLNSYYATPLGTPQGKQAHSIAAGENVTVAISGQATNYNVSGISAYLTGMVYNSTLYAGDGDAVSLNLECTPPLGYSCSSYETSAGTLTGMANPYTLTMPNADVTIQAVLVIRGIDYIDGDGGVNTCMDYTVLTGEEETLDAGWYVVDYDITYDTTLTLNGDVTLILCNGKTMTVASESGSGIMGFFTSLTLFGQSLNSDEAGILNVFGDGSGSAIDLFGGAYTQHSGNVVANHSDEYALFVGNLTLNGGSIEASGSSHGIQSDETTINGGSIKASGSSYGICVEENITINGGDIEAISSSCGVHVENKMTINGGIIITNGNHYGINAISEVIINGGKVEASRIFTEGNITLGWTTTDDYILAGRYDTSEGTISVKSGQAFYYEEDGEHVIVSGTLNSDQINAIGGKTLRPRGVNYMDGDGETHICINFTVLTGEEETLNAGWYVVNHDITYDSILTLNGDVTLILCNEKTMTVAPKSGEGIKNGNLTIYGQSLNSNAAGTLNVTSNGGHYAIDFGNYTQHSGSIYANAQSYCIRAGTMTINGGSIQASGGYWGIEAETLTVNGGKVEASSIKTRGDITLGWTNIDDYIRAGSYVANYGNGTISVKRGQAFYCEEDENLIVSGTLNSGQIQAIRGKTLRPYPLATYTLAPTAYTLTNSGYTDILCTLSSLELGEVWDNHQGSLIQASSLSFYMHGDTLSDGAGHSIPFLVDNKYHFGASAQMNQGGDYSSQGDTLIMAVYIDSIDYAAAMPGIYTGEFVYDSYWNCRAEKNNSIPGPSGSIMLTLEIGVNYMDGNGQMHVCTDYTVLTGNETSLETGWYVVDSTLNYTSTLTLTGDVKLILCNGKTMTVAPENGDGINLAWNNENEDLTIFSQSLDSIEAGTLNVTTYDDYVAPIIVKTYTQHSGNVVVNNNSTNGYALFTYRNNTMNGGSIVANGYFGIYVKGDMTINGGSINSSGYWSIYANSGLTVNGGRTDVNGDVYGIFVDHNGMTVTGGRINANGKWGIYANSGLTYGIYVNNNGMTVEGGSIDASGENGIFVCDGMTVEGGCIDATGNYGIYVIISDMTVEGGSINATGNCGIYVSSGMTVEGGQVETSSIQTAGNITLGWTHTEDSILVGNYHAEGTVSVKSGQTFYYENDGGEPVTVSGTINNPNSSIAGKTLRPYIAPTTVTKDIAGYGNGNGGWHLIASPLLDTIDPATVGNLIADTAVHYDLYRFDQAQPLEWRNYKADSTFKLETGKGYLYANTDSVTLSFNGRPYIGNGEVTLHKTAGDGISFPGWNLIGNPFNTEATLGNKPFYRMNALGTDIIAADNSTIAAMEGIFVVADTDGEIITFSTAATSKDRGQTHEPEQIVIDLSPLTSHLSPPIIDRAIIRFGEGQPLPKHQIHENSTKIYIPQDDKEYAVVNVGRDEMHCVSTEIPIHFKAAENGVYTFTISGTFHFPLSTLHLIDHLTGNDIDLLANPSYTFSASTHDDASRFRLVFKL